MVKKAKRTYWPQTVFVLTAILLCLAALTGNVRAESGVFDRAGLFSSGEITEMEALARSLEDRYKMNFLMLTVDDNGGKSSARVAEDFYEENGYNSNGRNGGIVLLIDTDSRELNLVTYQDMIYYITDKREESVYDMAGDYMRRKEYGNAMYAMLCQVQAYMEEGIPDDQYIYDTETGRIIRYRSLSASDWLIAAGGALLMALLGSFMLYRKYTVVPHFEYQINQNADMQLTGKNDTLINQFVRQRIIPKNPPSGRGGGGTGGSGRTSTHTSSGGARVGGGHGRSF